MVRVGLSTHYLLFQGVPLEEVPARLVEERPTTARPDLWELVDYEDYRMDGQRVRLFKPLVEVGYRFTLHAPFGEGFNIADPDRERRSRALRALERSAELAAEVEAEIWVFHPGRRTLRARSEQIWELNAEAVAELYDHARSLGITPGIENSHDGEVGLLNRPEDFLRLREEAGVRIGLVLDLGHAHVRGLVERFLELPGELIVEVHASDNRGGFDEHLNLGEGTVPWRRVVEALRRGGVIGPYIIESISEDPFSSVRFLKRMLAPPV
jgi:sugar phosphate isomerase/epimerase